jgi:hypothetical protein
MPLGTYTVEAISAGLKAVQTVHVDADEFRLLLELKPAEVTTSVVVTADPTETKSPAPSETITAVKLELICAAFATSNALDT